MSVTIGEARSMGDPRNERVTLDDRQERVEVIGGVVVQDQGRVPEGDMAEWTLDFDPESWGLVLGYWEARQIVPVGGLLEEGTVDARIIVKSYSRINRFRKYVTADLEIWRV